MIKLEVLKKKKEKKGRRLGRNGRVSPENHWAKDGVSSGVLSGGLTWGSGVPRLLHP